ncbi:hypothetical protein NLM33_41030 [Bradyrhizobium sp. CCGUVB1N3]|nr:hypothetical protein [Bradyrhizobium sp. CCGUVB1N3]MCP3476581.1 hypothetical protein [Bradyrhizobium sp. CCGUVB1N3]
MIDQLAAIGIEKGKTFNPAQKTVMLLDQAGHARRMRCWRRSMTRASR